MTDSSYLINDIYETLLRKQEIIQLVKLKYLSNESYEIRLPKYTLRELVDNFEYVISQCLRIINSNSKSSPLQSIDKELTNYHFNSPQETIEQPLSDAVKHEEKEDYPMPYGEEQIDFSKYTKELNLQFDYSKYANLSEPSHKASKDKLLDDVFKSTDLLEPEQITTKASQINNIKTVATKNTKKLKRLPSYSNSVDFEDFKNIQKPLSDIKAQTIYVFNDSESNRLSQANLNKESNTPLNKEYATTVHADSTSSNGQKGLRSRIRSSMRADTVSTDRSIVNENLIKKEKQPELKTNEYIEQDISYNNILKRINMVNGRGFFAKKYGDGLFDNFKKKLLGDEIAPEQVEEDIKALFEKFKNKRNVSVPLKTNKEVKNDRYKEPMKLEKILRTATRK
jgi:hypothetical protein